MADQEKEIKFYLSDMQGFLQRVEKANGKVTHPRVAEWNLRFDTPEKNLSTNGQALRLRKDERIRLTYKGPADLSQQITSRTELEVEVSDFETSRRILEALGFQVMVIYEKYRTTWELMGTEVVLDELPMGVFCEIEGDDLEQILAVVNKLELNWDRRITDSYLSIFGQLKAALAWPPVNLTYKEMKNLPVNSHDLAWINIHPADIEP
jgi:adenylate cyclase class 2